MISGSDIEHLAQNVVAQIREKCKVAIGFECPLFVPVRKDPQDVNAARSGESNRSWSAGAGTGDLATGLVELLWVMNKVNEGLGHPPEIAVRWNDFLGSDAVFIWEPFVTSTAKGNDHRHDARIAITHFLRSLPVPWSKNAIQESNVLSLLGAAALRAGWTKNVDILSEPCLVRKAVDDSSLRG